MKKENASKNVDMSIIKLDGSDYIKTGNHKLMAIRNLRKIREGVANLPSREPPSQVSQHNRQVCQFIHLNDVYYILDERIKNDLKKILKKIPSLFLLLIL